MFKAVIMLYYFPRDITTHDLDYFVYRGTWGQSIM